MGRALWRKSVFLIRDFKGLEIFDRLYSGKEERDYRLTSAGLTSKRIKVINTFHTNRMRGIKLLKNSREEQSELDVAKQRNGLATKRT